MGRERSGGARRGGPNLISQKLTSWALRSAGQTQRRPAQRQVFTLLGLEPTTSARSRICVEVDISSDYRKLVNKTSKGEAPIMLPTQTSGLVVPGLRPQ